MKWLFGSETIASKPLFRTFEERHFLDMLNTKTLFFAPLARFHDELEGTMSWVERWVSSVGPHLSHLVNDVLPRLSNRDLARPEPPPPSVLSWPFKYKPKIDSPEQIEQFLNIARDYVAASCWSLGQHEWNAHDSVKDVRVQTTPRLLAKCLESGGFELSSGPTFYPDDFNGLEDGTPPEGIYFRKMATYRTEDEYRLLVFDPTSNPLRDPKPEFRLCIKSFEFIRNLEFRNYYGLMDETKIRIEKLGLPKGRSDV